jgi:hypothetical protein
MGIRIAALD